MAELPSGTATFLLTDVEGSTALWEAAPEAMRAALARHDALFDEAVRRHGGVHIRPRGEGDSRFAVFSSAPGAVAAAVAIQRAFTAEDWQTPRPIRLRIGVHTGEAELRDGDYYGSAVNRCARLRGIGHGGQVLLSEVTTSLVREAMPIGAGLLDLGQHRLKDLTTPEHVFQVVVDDLASDFPSLSSLDARPNNLPTHPTALLGREREVAGVRALFQGGARLVTLTGPGGTGKTRLSLQVAADLLDDFEHGVFLVELAPISDPALVPSTITQVLGVRDVGSRTLLESLKAHLRDRSILLVLDNFEQIVAAATVVADLLATSPGLKVLVTSREPLRLRGEHEYDVPPLALPDAANLLPADMLPGYASVALFVERAAAIRANFAMTDENASAIVEICARLDGLPLAIELAAARVRTLRPQAIVDRLGQRLPLLTGGSWDLPTRQQTLRATIDWSYDLLDEDEQTLFRRLAVFVGGWTLGAAEAVCDGESMDAGPGGSARVPSSARASGPSTLSLLESLVAKSLIRQGGGDGELRFTMLETIREYALERLDESGEAARVRRRHAEHFQDVAERAEPALLGPEQGAWFDRLEAEHDNLRAALQIVVEDGEAEQSLRFGGALSHFWEVRGYHTEGRARLAGVLELAGARAHPQLWAKVHCKLGFLATDQGDYAEARALHEVSLAMMRGLGDERGVVRALMGLAWITTHEGDYATAHALHAESLAIGRELGDRRGIALAIFGLGHIAKLHGDHAAARAYDEESLKVMRELGDVQNIAWSLLHLGWVAVDQQDHVGARERLVEGLAIADELGDPRTVIDGIELSAHLALALGRLDCAARLRGAAEVSREAIGTPSSPTERAEDDIDIAAIRAVLGEPGFAAAWAEGRAMTLEQAVTYALEGPDPT